MIYDYHMSHSSTAVKRSSNNDKNSRQNSNKNNTNSNKSSETATAIMNKEQMANAAALLRQLSSPDRPSVFIPYSGSMSSNGSYSSGYSCDSCYSMSVQTEFRSGGVYTPK